MVAKDFNVPIASESELAVLYHFEKPKYKQLNKDADKIVEAIEDGVYSPSCCKELRVILGDQIASSTNSKKQLPSW
ncbi:hypothetical protein OK016_03665 [Vibrio chagasii]|nr:hypothetical protein [Vibrio chagasii]